MSQAHTDVAGHAISLATVLGAFASILPPVATLLAIVWYVLCIAESETVRRWSRRRRFRRLKRKKTNADKDH